MKNIFRLGLILTCIFSLSACSSSENHAFNPLTPMPGEFSEVIDPNDSALMTSIQSYISFKKGPAYSRYEFTRIDLDEDGRREGLVMMNSPYQFWCGRDGCTVIVFKAINGGFSPITEITPIRGPLVVSELKTNGWKDIIVRVSGREHTKPRDVALKYDGRSYPTQPGFQKALYASNQIDGVRIFP
jgi:hypothetical protein